MADKEVITGRCQNCRASVVVPDSFTDGDTLKCGVCRISLKLQRTGGIRLTIADVAPLRDEVRLIQQRLRGLESDRASARRSVGIGVYGPLFGVAYLVHRIGIKEEHFSSALFVQAAGVVLLAAVALELANFLFLGKRRKIALLSRDIKENKAHMDQLQAKIQEFERG